MNLIDFEQPHIEAVEGRCYDQSSLYEIGTRPGVFIDI